MIDTLHLFIFFYLIRLLPTTIRIKLFEWIYGLYYFILVKSPSKISKWLQTFLIRKFKIEMTMRNREDVVVLVFSLSLE